MINIQESFNFILEVNVNLDKLVNLSGKLELRKLQNRLDSRKLKIVEPNYPLLRYRADNIPRFDGSPKTLSRF